MCSGRAGPGGGGTGGTVPGALPAAGCTGAGCVPPGRRTGFFFFFLHRLRFFFLRSRFAAATADSCAFAWPFLRFLRCLGFAGAHPLRFLRFLRLRLAAGVARGLTLMESAAYASG